MDDRPLPDTSPAPDDVGSNVVLRWLGRAHYTPTLDAMRRFTARRDTSSADEIWLLEHPPVYTQGVAGRAEHVRDPGDIPVVATERGGQVTYHGPGQLVAYVLVDLRRRRLGVRDLVCRIEQATIGYLGSVGIAATRRERAPGVYVRDRDGASGGAKIASIGLKVSHGRSYHGLSLNVAMDLEPFSRIDPCGMPGLAVTDLRGQGVDIGVDTAAAGLAAHLLAGLGVPRATSPIMEPCSLPEVDPR